jgi:hypothetical protein
MTHILHLLSSSIQDAWGRFEYSFDLGHVHFVMIDSEAYVGRFTTDQKLKRHHDWVKEG